MLQMNRLVLQYQNCCHLSLFSASHYSSRITYKPTASLISSTGHDQSGFGTLMPSARSFSSKTDQPDNHDSKTGPVERKQQSNDYRNKHGSHDRADLLGRPFANRDIDNRWQGLLHDRKQSNDSTMGFPSYSGPVVSLHSAMQSNVPKPYFPNDRSSFPTHNNMPGGGVKAQQKFLYGGLHSTHPSNQKREESYPVKFAVPVHATTEAETHNQPVSIEYQETKQNGFDTDNRNQTVYENGEESDMSVSHIQASASTPSNASQIYASSINKQGTLDSLQNTHFTRYFSHGSTLAPQPEVTYVSPCPQGIQGNDCVYFQQWMESCLRYGLTNCEEQLENLKSGRKTLQQVLDEQQKIIEEAALNMKSKTSLNGATTTTAVAIHSANEEHLLNKHRSVSDVYQKHHQDSKDEQKAVEPAFEGWMQTALNRIRTVSLRPQQLQYRLHHHHHHHHHQQQQRTFSTSNWFSNSKGPITPENKTETQQTSTTIPAPDTVSSTSDAPIELTRRQQLQRAVKEYGSTVMVFHITISLMSLGGFYLAVSSGIDLVGLMMKLGIGENILKSRLATGASTFVVAYAVHKVFAPVRIGITLSATPLIVKYLRLKGILKPPKPKPISK
ncbi:uncharacterized protein LOC106881681 [Octopus bimaculoides]|uniref:DUF1279 domain-containing protein n=1 Tax=Octopus bimaculoides TaxID=37653 RepID=A0A0L8FRA1_OCTBM|nr:uncharacterized protein LOC106881681 [Octopus bimaculoides]|eukprot:XP_014787632.1 PREDICTED: uncharacterized protein LOC106881681 [Octopus bimaculoides]